MKIPKVYIYSMNPSLSDILLLILLISCLIGYCFVYKCWFFYNFLGYILSISSARCCVLVVIKICKILSWHSIIFFIGCCCLIVIILLKNCCSLSRRFWFCFLVALFSLASISLPEIHQCCACRYWLNLWWLWWRFERGWGLEVRMLLESFDAWESTLMTQKLWYI